MNLQGFYTNKGRLLAAKIAAGTTALTITRVVAGSGHTEDIPSAASLPDIEQTLSVGTAAVSGATATLPVTLAEALSTASYNLTELGVYASDPDEGEILFQVYQLDIAAAITAGGEGVLRFYLRQTIGAQGVTVTCSPAGIVLDGDLDPLRAAISKKPDAVIGETWVYVSKNGSDTDGDGSLQNPFLTIQHAVDSLPRCLAGDVHISVLSGSYDENITIAGFFGGGSLTAGGAYSAQVDIQTINAENNACRIIITNLYVNGTGGSGGYNWSVRTARCHWVRIENVKCVEPVSEQNVGSFCLLYTPFVWVVDCEISNKRVAVDACGSTVYFNNNVTGQNNTIGIRAGSDWHNCGGIVQKANSTIAGTETKEYGGQIW